jgi:SNF2 family DNA or RNA helicase
VKATAYDFSSVNQKRDTISIREELMTLSLYGEPLFKTGDRIELRASAEELRHAQVVLGPALNGFLTKPNLTVMIETKHGSVPAEHDPVLGVLKSSPLSEFANRAGALMLDCVGAEPWYFRVRFEPAVEPRGPSANLVTEQGVSIAFAPEDAALLRNDSLALARLRDFQLSLEASRLGMVAGFEQLLALPWLRDVDLLDHQLRTARAVLRQLRGRALLCDEVGLGKTVEAGIILLELVVRGLARRVLVLTPPSLVEQWQGELSRKFGLDFVVYDDPHFKEQSAAAWSAHDRIIASYHTAKREPHRHAILDREWDVVIIDEVHHFRNRTTQLWRMAAELRKKYILLLTATPVQNNLEELFNLVTLLQPGLLSTARAFQREFVNKRDKLMPRNVEQLHRQLEEVMVRNRRSTVGLRLTRRIARTQVVTLSESERALYDDVSQFIRQRLRKASETRHGAWSRMSLITLQKELGSSSQAAAPTLERLASGERLPAADRQTLEQAAARARRIQKNAKVDYLLKLLGDFPDKLVVFTEFRETQAMLQRYLAGAGESVALFHGGLTRLEKEEAIRRFQGATRILLTTDAGSEGRNLQFCNAICNFDLPWNPMKIEQRIGRLSRIGQTRDVHVFNLVAADTLEAAMLHLLEAKIAMFELVIGEIDMILGNLDEEKEFEDLVTDLWVEAQDPSEFRTALEHLGDKLVAAKEAYWQQRAYEDKLFGERFAPEG